MLKMLLNTIHSIYCLLKVTERSISSRFSFSVSDLRLKFMTLLMLIVLSISITITVLRYGRAVLQDNFVAELSTHYQNSTEFVSFYGLLNIYMYTMAFVYSPSHNAVFGESYKEALWPCWPFLIFALLI